MNTKSTIRDATKSVAKVLSADKPVEETDILDTLKLEHEEVKELLEKLQSAESAAERRQLVGKIKAALVPHTRKLSTTR
jgi:hypothetical protein